MLSSETLADDSGVLVDPNLSILRHGSSRTRSSYGATYIGQHFKIGQDEVSLIECTITSRTSLEMLVRRRAKTDANKNVPLVQTKDTRPKIFSADKIPKTHIVN